MELIFYTVAVLGIVASLCYYRLVYLAWRLYDVVAMTPLFIPKIRRLEYAIEKANRHLLDFIKNPTPAKIFYKFLAPDFLTCAKCVASSTIGNIPKVLNGYVNDVHYPAVLLNNNLTASAFLEIESRLNQRLFERFGKSDQTTLNTLLVILNHERRYELKELAAVLRVLLTVNWVRQLMLITPGDWNPCNPYQQWLQKVGYRTDNGYFKVDVEKFEPVFVAQFEALKSKLPGVPDIAADFHRILEEEFVKFYSDTLTTQGIRFMINRVYPEFVYTMVTTTQFDEESE